MAKRKQGPTYTKKQEDLKGLSTKKDINLPLETIVPKTHPSDVEEGMIERVIKKSARARGAYLDEDEPYLEQYLHPDKDILEVQPDRPTIGKPDDLPHRKLHIIPSSRYDDELYNVEGLGHFKYDKSNPKYDSVYDKWDFDTDSSMIDQRKPEILPSLANIESWIAKEAMKRAGKPYTVYERVPKGTDQRKWKTGK